MAWGASFHCARLPAVDTNVEVLEAAMRADGNGGGGKDAAEALGRVLAAKGEVLLHVYRQRLGREDLEDCLAQAVLELIDRARTGALEDDEHIVNALEQKFLWRVADRRRALRGRDRIEAAMNAAVRPFGVEHRVATVTVVDEQTDAVAQAELRDELARMCELADELTEDQRLVLACQVALGMEREEFAARFGWSAAKFRKVDQRGRRRLRALMDEYESGRRCRRFRSQLSGYVSGSLAPPRSERVRRHLVNCRGCAATAARLRLGNPEAPAIAPLPLLLAGGGLLAGGVRRAWSLVVSAFGGDESDATIAGRGVLAAATTGVCLGVAKASVAALLAAGVLGGSGVPAPQEAPSSPSSPVPAAAQRSPLDRGRSGESGRLRPLARDRTGQAIGARRSAAGDGVIGKP
jgi:DNA-directed RNA polymerase specialized sigma24 family protein